MPRLALYRSQALDCLPKSFTDYRSVFTPCADYAKACRQLDL